MATKTHRVTVQSLYGDARPSQKWIDIMGNRCGPATSHGSEWRRETTEHGAKCLFTRELNAIEKYCDGAYHVATEVWETPKRPDRRVVFVLTRYEGAYYTDVIISEELWPQVGNYRMEPRRAA